MGTKKKKKKNSMLHTFHSSPQFLPLPHSSSGTAAFLLGQLHDKHAAGHSQNAHGRRAQVRTTALPPRHGSFCFRRPQSCLLAADSRVDGTGGGRVGRIILINMYRSILLDKKKLKEKGEVELLAYGTGQS